ncbi:MAG: peptidoglycan DD-metalloendopeptidase family protein [Actinomycetota bacterium]
MARWSAAVALLIALSLVPTSTLVAQATTVPADPTTTTSPDPGGDQTTVPPSTTGAAPTPSDSVPSTTTPGSAPTSTDPSVASTGPTTSIPADGTTEGSTPDATPVDGEADAATPSTTDADGETVDPLADEGRSEEAPGVDPEIPPPDTYVGQEPYRAPEILWSSVAEAERKLERSRQAKREAVAEARALRLRAKHLDVEQRALDRRTRDLLDELDGATERYRDRAIAGFRRFAASSTATPSAAIDPGDLEREMAQRRGDRLAEEALVIGGDDLDELVELRRGLDGDARSLLDRLQLVADYQLDAEAAVVVADEAIEQAEIEYAAFSAGSEVFVNGVLFPIAGPYQVPIIDSFGFPRMTGTPDEHWHEGIDIFAPRGTPLVAAERGIVTRIGIGRLGGLKFWLLGESGSEWYYAHLDSFAPGLTDGLLVEAGDLLGHVGNTGNAVGTPPHLHLQLHPGGGRPVNPYPLLAIVSDLDQQALADGTHPGWEHDPVVVAQPAPPAPAAEG